jgi:DHA1 family inner membrane transport protein
MLGPTRSLDAIRPGAPFPLLLSALATALMFGATPFLLPALAERYVISEGLASSISIAQVGVFAAATLLLPRLLAPSGGLLRTAAVVLAVGNLASAFSPNFLLLVLVRGVAGGAAGILTWIMWVDAMSSPRSLASISSIGPLTALVGAPVLAVIAEHGARAVYLTLAAVTIPAVAAKLRTVLGKPGKRVVSRSRSNRVLLGALFLLALSGASLFVFAAVAARELLAISPVAASWGFSLNAAGGLLGARLATRHRRPGWWLASAGPAAFLAISGGSAALFFFGMAWWGFAWWMGIPGVLQMLAERSLAPGERAGDAQGVMAIGRAIAPAIGGGFADAAAYVGLAAVAGAGLTVAGVVVVGVQEGREHLPPTEPLGPHA